MRRPSADREEKRVTLGNDIKNPQQDGLTTIPQSERTLRIADAKAHS